MLPFQVQEMREEMNSDFKGGSIHDGQTHNIVQCQQETVKLSNDMKVLRDDKAKLAKEVKDLRARTLQLEKEKTILTKRLGTELSNEHAGEAAAEEAR